MLENIFVTLIILVLMLVIGGGWGTLISQDLVLPSSLNRFFWTLITALILTSIVGTIAVALNVRVIYAWTAILPISLVGWFKAKNKAALKSFTSHSVFRKELLLPVFGILFLSTFSAQGIFQGGQPLRIGPDSIGNATAVAGLAKGKTQNVIRHELQYRAPKSSLQELLDPELTKFYETPSIQTQIETEFLVTGLRWGFSASAALIVQPAGLERIWIVLNSLGNIALMTSSVGVFLVLRKSNLVRGAKSFALISSSFAPIILNGFREGGVAQVWVIPSTVAILLVLVTRSVTDLKSQILIAAILAYSAVSYSDLFIIQVISLIFLAILNEILNKKNPSIASLLRIGSLSFLIGLPFFIEFLRYLPRRMGDAGIAGWSMPYWTSMSESIGLLNRFNQQVPDGLKIRSAAGAANSLVFDLVILFWLFKSSKRSQTDTRVLLGIAAFLTIGVIRFKTEIIDEVTNYQYFKAFGSLLPVVVIGLTILMFENGKETSGEWGRKATAIIFSISAAFSIINYKMFFDSSSKFLPFEFGTREFTKEIRALDRMNFFAPRNIQTMALAPYTEGFWIGRSDQRTEDLSTTKDLPVSIVVLKDECPDWSCLKNLRGNQVVFQSKSISAINLFSNARELQQSGSSKNWRTLVQQRLREMGGPQLNDDFTIKQ